MKPHLSSCIAALLGATSAGAAPADQAIIAAMRLSGQPNYGWTATIDATDRCYDVQGKTERGGFSRVQFPVVSGRRATGHRATVVLDAVFAGSAHCVVATDGGWCSLDELVHPARDFDQERTAAQRTGQALGIGVPRGVSAVAGVRPPGASARAPQLHAGLDAADLRGFSGLQFAIAHPHEELAILVSTHTRLDADPACRFATGELSADGIRLLLLPDGRDDIVVRPGAGTFRLWLRDGEVARYEIALVAELQLGRKTIETRQTRTVILKDIGHTVVDVPAEARARLLGWIDDAPPRP